MIGMCGTLHPQSVAVPALVSPLPGVVQPAQTLSCPVTGKTAKCTIPQQTLLKPSQTTTTAQTAPVNLSGTNLSFSVTLTPDQAKQLLQILSNGGAMTGITITLVKP